MGYYANPVSEITANCRKLNGRKFDELTAQLQEGEGLVGVYQRPAFPQAPLLYSEREFEGFEDQARRGVVQRIGFYAVPLIMFPTYLEHMREAK